MLHRTLKTVDLDYHSFLLVVRICLAYTEVTRVVAYMLLLNFDQTLGYWHSHHT